MKQNCLPFADKGEGIFVSYLAQEKNIVCVVRDNGGLQTSYIVITLSEAFRQLGSGMLLEEGHIYLTENVVINLEQLFFEMEAFSKKFGILFSEIMDKIHIHESCFVVTPYHELISKLRGFSKGANGIGTVQTAESEVKYLLSEPKCFPYEQSLGLQVKDIFNPYSNNLMISRLEAFQDYVSAFYQSNKEDIWENVPEEMRKALEREIAVLLEPRAFLDVASDYVIKIKRANFFYKCILH